MRARAVRLVSALALPALLVAMPGGPGSGPAFAQGVGWGALGTNLPRPVTPGGVSAPGGTTPGGASTGGTSPSTSPATGQWVPPGRVPTTGGFFGTSGTGQGNAHNSQEVDCRAEPPGFHDAKAKVKFTAFMQGTGQVHGGKQFDYGAVRDLLINVDWQDVRTSARQRLALYSPDGHLYQLFTTVLDAHPAPVDIMLPVRGSTITSATLTGTWCVKVFLDDDPQPIAADTFELRRP